MVLGHQQAQCRFTKLDIISKQFLWPWMFPITFQRSDFISKIPFEIVPLFQHTDSQVHKVVCLWVRSWNCGCLVTWFCYQLIAKPGNKTATVSWPDPYMRGTVAFEDELGTIKQISSWPNWVTSVLVWVGLHFGRMWHGFPSCQKQNAVDVGNPQVLIPCIRS